jgi:hypothetical protein
METRALLTSKQFLVIYIYYKKFYFLKEMNRIDIVLEFMSENKKLNMKYTDYLSLGLMIIGFSISMIFIFLIISGVINSDNGGGFQPPWAE